MNLYTPEGWVDMAGIMDEGYPFTLVCGGRGTGKTFGALVKVRQESAPGNRFIYLRRTQTQLDLLNKPEFSPWRSVDKVLETVTVTRSITKYNAGYYDGVLMEDGTAAPEGPPLGVSAALSTFSNLRSFDSDASRILYDEFIPQAGDRPIKDEAEALWNCYETVNRNRELADQDPVQLVCMANANTIGNPIFLDLGLVQVAERMRSKGREWWTDDRRGILLVQLLHSRISDAKRNTALYRLQEGTEFTQMALDNDFAYEERGSTGSLPLRELVPIVAVGEICLYRKKNGEGYYCTGHKSGSPDQYGAGPRELTRFRNRYSWMRQAYLGRRIQFEQYVHEILLAKYLIG